jgi:cardiolipin synthase
MDVRSFRLNFEVAAIFYDRRDVDALRADVDDILSASELLTSAAYSRRPLMRRLLNGTARVFGPVM